MRARPSSGNSSPRGMAVYLGLSVEGGDIPSGPVRRQTALIASGPAVRKTRPRRVDTACEGCETKLSNPRRSAGALELSPPAPPARSRLDDPPSLLRFH